MGGGGSRRLKKHYLIKGSGGKRQPPERWRIGAYFLHVVFVKVSFFSMSGPVRARCLAQLSSLLSNLAAEWMGEGRREVGRVHGIGRANKGGSVELRSARMWSNRSLTYVCLIIHLRRLTLQECGAASTCAAPRPQKARREREREPEPAHLITVPFEPNFPRCALRVGLHLQETNLTV